MCLPVNILIKRIDLPTMLLNVPVRMWYTLNVLKKNYYNPTIIIKNT